MIVALLLACLALIAALDSIASVRIVRSDAYTPRQKAAQVLIVWVVPIVGAIVVLSVLKATAPGRGYPADVEFPDARLNLSGPTPEHWGGGNSNSDGPHNS
jgi:hypothetical protein